MQQSEIDFDLIAAWLAGRSIAREVSPPVRDRGGLRVDTNSADETRRWVFPHLVPGVREIGMGVGAPHHAIKLCANSKTLAEALGTQWGLQALSHVMVRDQPQPSADLPAGYMSNVLSDGARTQVRIVAPNGNLAGSGYAAETADAFVYDRIVVEPAHQRIGVGSALMAALGESRRSPTTRQILVATHAGRALYGHLGWSYYAPYASAVTITA